MARAVPTGLPQTFCCHSCRPRLRVRRGFSIVELVIVTIVIGVLAAAGLAKYQEFAESSRRKICLANLMNLETCLAVWETTHENLAENAKCSFGFTPRSGRLTDTEVLPSLLDIGPSGAVAAMADPQPVVGGPTSFVNSLISGPLNSVIRDDRIWLCPSAVARYYGGEIQYVPDDYLDTLGGGLPGRPRGAPIGLGGRYLCAVASLGNRALSTPITNGGFPAGWIADGAVPPDSALPSPCPQPPFRIFICGAFGTFGTGNGVPNIPGSTIINGGGPVGPDGSTLSRHSSRW
jgi:prepilin-type N-terminal cleavage/methylation domain-containing protein